MAWCSTALTLRYVANHNKTQQSATLVQNSYTVLYVQIDSLVQDCSNSSTYAMELLQSCTKPSNYVIVEWWTNLATYSAKHAHTGSLTSWCNCYGRCLVIPLYYNNYNTGTLWVKRCTRFLVSYLHVFSFIDSHVLERHGSRLTNGRGAWDHKRWGYFLLIKLLKLTWDYHTGILSYLWSLCYTPEYPLSHEWQWRVDSYRVGSRIIVPVMATWWHTTF